MATRLWVGGSAEDWAGEGYQFGSRTLLSGGGPGRTVPLYDVDTDEQLTDLLDRDGNPVTAATSHDAIGHWGPVQLPEGVPSARVGPNRTLVIGRSTHTGSDAAAAKQARDEAEAFSATTQELQDGAVSTLVDDESSQTHARLSAMTEHKIDESIDERLPRIATGVVVLTASVEAGVRDDVVFPAGAFTGTPIVMVTKQGSTLATFVPYVDNITAGGCRIGLYDGGGASRSGTVTVGWIAVQF